MAIYSSEELQAMGFKHLGKDVRISTKCSIYGAGEISLADHVRVDDFCVLSGNISIGSYVHIAVYSSIFGGVEGVTIEDFANISSRVAIYALSDDYSGETMTNPMIDEQFKKVEHGKVRIGRHSIIGTCSTVLPNVDIGEGCAFGAYSFINHSCEPWGMYVGIPCKKYKSRSNNLLRYEAKIRSLNADI